MSFVGAIGHLMAGSGLHEDANNAVDHILSGRAIVRAVRAVPMFVDAALILCLHAQFHYETYLEDDCDAEIANDNEMEDTL